MARREVPKEDLVRDATAFATRVELRESPDDPAWTFVGLREDGGGSIYFGDDEFYAFNPKGELRRAFRDGRLLKAEGGRLVAMRRERTDDASFLASGELSEDRTHDLLQSLSDRIAKLIASLSDGSLVVNRSDGNATSDHALVRDWLSLCITTPITVAERPHAGG